MTPERVDRIRQKLAEARAKGAGATTTVDLMVLTVGELEALLDNIEHHNKRTSELLANCNRWEQAYRDVKASLAAAITFAKHAAAALGQDYYP